MVNTRLLSSLGCAETPSLAVFLIGETSSIFNFNNIVSVLQAVLLLTLVVFPFFIYLSPVLLRAETFLVNYD